MAILGVFVIKEFLSFVFHQGEVEEELSIERRRKWLAAISREGLTEEIVNSGSVWPPFR